MKTNEQKVADFIFENDCRNYSSAYLRALMINHGDKFSNHLIKNQWTPQDAIDEILKVKEP